MRSDSSPWVRWRRNGQTQVLRRGGAPGRQASLLAGVLGGVAQAIATPPYSIWPLAWCALLPLWLATDRRSIGSIRRALAIALVWGISYNALSLRWILQLHPLTWMGVPYGASVAVAIACWLAVTLWGSATAVLWVLLLRGLTSRGLPVTGAGKLPLGAGLWCGLDGLMSASPLYWNPIALSQSPHNRPLLHLGQWGGPMLITALLVGVNGLIFLVLRTPFPQQRRRWGLGALAVMLLAHGLGGLIWIQPLQDLPSQALRIGVIQGNIPTRIKLTPAGIETAISRYTAGYQRLAQAGAEAVLMPEGAFPFVWSTHESLEPPWRPSGGAIAWIGTFGWHQDRPGSPYQQNLLSLAPPQTVPESRYSKVKLVPLGEYLPLENLLGSLIQRISPLASGMVPGEPGQQFQTSLGLAAVQICYEPAFSGLLRQQVAQGATFILSLANLDPYPEMLMAQSEAHDVMRAIESDRWLARAANTGYSGFIDPKGRVLWRSPPQTFVYRQATLFRRQTQTLYSRWGNWTTPLLLGSGALLCLIGAAHRSRLNEQI